MATVVNERDKILQLANPNRFITNGVPTRIDPTTAVQTITDSLYTAFPFNMSRDGKVNITITCTFDQTTSGTFWVHTYKINIDGSNEQVTTISTTHNQSTVTYTVSSSADISVTTGNHNLNIYAATNGHIGSTHGITINITKKYF